MARKRLAPQDYRVAQRWTDVMTRGGTVFGVDSQKDAAVRSRLLLLGSATIVVMALMLGRLFFMQAVYGSGLRADAEGNRVRVVVDYAPRGKIMDRNGVVLADNTLTFQLSATPYLMSSDEQQRRNDIKRIAAALSTPRSEIEAVIAAHGSDSVLPVLIAEQVSHTQAIQISASIDEIPGFELEKVPTRRYDSSAGLAHVVGYTGRVNEADLEADDGGLIPTDIIGRSGVEAAFDEQLRGSNGWRRIEVDAFGRPVRLLAEKAPEPGKDLHLSIDTAVQSAMARAMTDQMEKAGSQRAAGVALDPQTGAVIAMVSLPSFDNNLFTNAWDDEQFARLVRDARQPLYNKVIAGGYTTGSIIKPLVASAALQEGVVNERTVIVDSGAISLPGGFVFRGWRPEGLGAMNVRSAIAWSSNIYFYTVGGGYGAIQGLGEERLTHYYRLFGLGEASGLPLPGEIDGRVPDEDWKREQTGEGWYVGDSYNISIGQGDLLVSPLQISMAHAAIANNGRLLRPSIEKEAGVELRRELTVDKSYLQIVREGMRQVLTDGTTCECTFSEVDAVVAGKSGTAETNTPDGRPPHAWFTAFAPYEQPEILATVLIEEGVGGSQFAAPVIAETMESYFRE